MSPRKSLRRLSPLPDGPTRALPSDLGDASEEDGEGDKADEAFGPALAGRLTRLPPKKLSLLLSSTPLGNDRMCQDAVEVIPGFKR